MLAGFAMAASIALSTCAGSCPSHDAALAIDTSGDMTATLEAHNSRSTALFSTKSPNAWAPGVGSGRLASAPVMRLFNALTALRMTH